VEACPAPNFALVRGRRFKSGQVHKYMPHIHEKIDFTVEVFIVYKKKVLLRKHDKYGFWLSIGGHIELNEDPNEAALREVKEEVGLDVRLTDDLLAPISSNEEYRELIPPKFLNRHRINENHEHVTLTYFAVANSDQILEGETERSNEWKWFTKEELKNKKYDLREGVAYCATRALNELGD